MSGACRVFAVVSVLVLAGCGPIQRMTRGYAGADSEALGSAEASLSPEAPQWLRGQTRFLFEDFGTLDTDLLETYGLPWKLVAASLVLRRHDVEGAPVSSSTLRRSLSSFGFLQPGRIANWRGPRPDRLRRPVGVVSGQASRRFPRVEVEVAVLGCAACHAGTGWDSQGNPTGEAWLGLPNTSLDLDAFGDSVTAALREGVGSPDRLLAAVGILFPDVDGDEIATLRKHVIPRARDEIAALDAAGERRLPFVNGGPGTTNGVASTQHVLSFPIAEPGRVAFTAIPFLGDRQLRSSLLADGLYAIPGRPRFIERSAPGANPDHLDGLAGIVSTFVVSAMGGSVVSANESVPAVRDVARFIATLEPPRFPGPIDTVRARAGRSVYLARCSGCHGKPTPGLHAVRIARFPNRLVPADRIGTDTSRARGAGRAPLGELGAVGLGRHAVPAATGGYVAPLLSAVWATAPYLHNNSVPTLWHLMHPDERPERFEVGGHALDLERVGVRGESSADGVYRMPGDHRPWSTPFVYDTRLPGRGNGGHTRPFEGLTEEQKSALLEYLKLL